MHPLTPCPPFYFIIITGKNWEFLLGCWKWKRWSFVLKQGLELHNLYKSHTCLKGIEKKPTPQISQHNSSYAKCMQIGATMHFRAEESGDSYAGLVSRWCSLQLKKMCISFFLSNKDTRVSCKVENVENVSSRWKKKGNMPQPFCYLDE